ncbi:beta-L-arabinofuranosidase domain-containing protein [Sphingomonas sp.]|uniref:beta-L-arabinofuranosidase domain-containing protein n=1 Tax=Sphingomonas sp. TaxID=28214 RepID=UPI002D7EEE32|nr:beta-L-arabinofuranosidase domain-containing protein [Sphingomonas sp.]HEU0043974.1 beta-L-arabinofuranosidase domain-containing protein [Sphingomonas sp.]
MTSSVAMTLAAPGAVTLGGLLGDAVEANRRGRLSTFITGPDSPPITIFDPATVAANEGGDWYGEHAGKWLYAAARAAVRADDTALLARVRAVADHLVGLQDAEGYLGNYPPHRRFTVKQPPKPVSWNGEPALRTWDIWTHAYLILGLLEVAGATGDDRYGAAACAIGDLAWRTLSGSDVRITDLGNHFGLSATVLLDPACALYFATGERRYLNLALLVLEQAEADPHSAFLTAALAGADPSEIATGKAYQLLWNLVGLAKLHRATGERRYLTAVHLLWEKVRQHHLTLGGGPWGGVAHRSREVFNPAGVFDPHAYVETCSTMAWIQLNRELLTILGEAKFAQAIERSAYNDLLGAQSADGEDWCYYSFPNGKRVHTTYWRCCKSSGSIAVEELPELAYGVTAGGEIAINLLGPSAATLDVPGIGAVSVSQVTDYPLAETIEIVVDAGGAEVPLLVRIPDWADGATLTGMDGALTPDTYARVLTAGTVTLTLPMPPRLHHAVARNVQESLAPDGSRVAQEVLRRDYVGLTAGPLVYATQLIDGFKAEETVRLGDDAVRAGDDRTLLLMPRDRAPIAFEPYYRADGRRDGAWRLTWLRVAPEAGA